MKHKLYKTYMACAEAFAKQSYAKRKQVGAIAVTPQDIIIYSWNGTAQGDDNACEEKVRPLFGGCGLMDEDYILKEFPFEDEDGRYKLVTKAEVLHCEQNIIAKAAREGLSLKGSTIFVTLSPCILCSKQLVQAGVERVVYKEEYRDLTGIKYLKTHNVIVERYKEE